MEKNEVRIMLGASILVMLLVGVLFYVIESNVPIDNSDYINALLEQNNQLDKNLAQANIKIISLQENAEYIGKTMLNTKNQYLELQVIYNDVWNDATSCYWANACTERPGNCEEHFSGNATASELQTYYSTQCYFMNNNWDEYNANDTS